MDLEKLRELFGGITRRTVSQASTNAPAEFDAFRQPARTRTEPRPRATPSAGEPGYNDWYDAELQRHQEQKLLGPGRPLNAPQSEPRPWDDNRTILDDMNETRAEANARIHQKQFKPLPRHEQEFDASTLEFMRGVRQSSARELTQEEFDALSDRQKAAVRFNTALLDASLADDQAGNTQSTEDFVGLLGLQDTSGDALDEFLQLDRLIGESIIMKLDDAQPRQDSASSLRWARGDTGSAPEATRFANAQSSTSMMQDAITRALATTGRLPGAAEAPRPGFGGSDRDAVIQQAYTTMIDSRYDLTADDVAQGIAELNSINGTDVTPQEVWDYLGAQIGAAVQASQDSVLAPDFYPNTATPFAARQIDDLQKRYGF